MKHIVVGLACALAVQSLFAPKLFSQNPFSQNSLPVSASNSITTVAPAAPIPSTPNAATTRGRLGIVHDWTNRHVLYPESKDASVKARLQKDPRWLNNWYVRHPEGWWPEYRRDHHRHHDRDWIVPLSATPATAAFDPLFDFIYTINLDIGYGSVSTTDAEEGQFLATSGFLTVIATGDGGPDGGTYPLYPGGPAQTSSPLGSFLYDNVVFPSQVPVIDNNGLLFTGGGYEINVWSDFPGPDDYEFDDSTAPQVYTNDATGVPFSLIPAPGYGQTFPAKYAFDVNDAPSCTNDYVVIGIPSAPAAGGQANIVAVNNLYAGTAGALCPTGPTVMFAYASGSGQVPASVVISQHGTQVAYIENLPSGSAYFHSLTLGTTGTNGTSASAAVAPGSAGGNNAVDQTVLLSPDGGTTTQSSTTAPWVVYTPNDLNDVAYVTTFGVGTTNPPTETGYLFKITNVFNGGTPTIVWSLPINAIPSTPVYDIPSNTIFFTDSNGSIDYVVDSGTPTVVYGTPLSAGATSENPVTIDSTNEMVYATFNSNGTNALVVQAPTSMASSVSVAVGAASTIYESPYEPDFNNAWYTGTGTPEMYVAVAVAGPGTESTNLTMPTLYSVGFSGGIMNSTADATTADLATGTADASPVTEFYNSTLGTDFLFVGVTDNCVATVEAGNGGCVMSLDITSGFPTVNANSTALHATGGTTGIIVDNNSSDTEASSIYYGTKTGATLVKATQSGLQ